jgi:hypothetical protein
VTDKKKKTAEYPAAIAGRFFELFAKEEVVYLVV